MKTRLLKIVLAIALSVLASSFAQALSLVDLGNGVIWEQDKHLMWLQDANYARTSGYDLDGRMSWQGANEWAENLVYAGYQDWRLPTTPSNRMESNGFYRTSSEMGHMYYDELGNAGEFDANGLGQPGVDWLTKNMGPFRNVQIDAYWSSTDTESWYPGNAWIFNWYNGAQGPSDKPYGYFAWAVRDGDPSAVPVPGTVWLLGSGLIGFGWSLIRKRR